MTGTNLQFNVRRHHAIYCLASFFLGMALILVSCRSNDNVLKPIKVLDDLVIHRGIPLIDLSGHGWTSLEDYSRNMSAGEGVILLEMRMDLHLVIQRVLPDTPAKDLPRILAMNRVEYREEAAFLVTFSASKTPQAQKLRAEVKRIFKDLRVSINGQELPLADNFVIEMTGAYAFVSMRNEGGRATISWDDNSKQIALSRIQRVKLIKYRGRHVPDIVGTLALFSDRPEASLFHKFCSTDYSIFCLHPPGGE